MSVVSVAVGEPALQQIHHLFYLISGKFHSEQSLAATLASHIIVHNHDKHTQYS